MRQKLYGETNHGLFGFIYFLNNYFFAINVFEKKFPNRNYNEKEDFPGSEKGLRMILLKVL
jgi:hypothetical protein